MWNEKDYSHEGLGKIMKELNGNHLTKNYKVTAGCMILKFAWDRRELEWWNFLAVLYQS
jgi:hypothetical protein